MQSGVAEEVQSVVFNVVVSSGGVDKLQRVLQVLHHFRWQRCGPDCRVDLMQGGRQEPVLMRERGVHL